MDTLWHANETWMAPYGPLVTRGLERVGLVEDK